MNSMNLNTLNKTNLPTYKIRFGTLSDLLQIEEVHKKSIRNLCSKDYRPDQIKGWSAVIYDPIHLDKSIKNDHYKVLVSNDYKIVGFCHSGLNRNDSSVGEIFGLYLDPDVTKNGLGKKLVLDAFGYFESLNLKKYYVESTRTALQFYQKMGFVVCSEEKLYATRGIEFEYVEMEQVVP